MKLHDVTPALLRAHPLPDHADDGSKQHRGQVLLIAGSRSVPGAALLAGLSALRAGAGVLQIATCESVAGHVAVALPEAMVVGCSETPAGGIDPSNAERLFDLASRADAVLIGPGMIDDDAVGLLTAKMLGKVGESRIVLDAAAFTTPNLSHLTGRHTR